MTATTIKNGLCNELREAIDEFNASLKSATLASEYEVASAVLFSSIEKFNSYITTGFQASYISEDEFVFMLSHIDNALALIDKKLEHGAPKLTISRGE